MTVTYSATKYGRVSCNCKFLFGEPPDKCGYLQFSSKARSQYGNPKLSKPYVLCISILLVVMWPDMLQRSAS